MEGWLITSLGSGNLGSAHFQFEFSIFKDVNFHAFSHISLHIFCCCCFLRLSPPFCPCCHFLLIPPSFRSFCCFVGCGRTGVGRNGGCCVDNSNYHTMPIFPTHHSSHKNTPFTFYSPEVRTSARQGVPFSGRYNTEFWRNSKIWENTLVGIMTEDFCQWLGVHPRATFRGFGTPSDGKPPSFLGPPAGADPPCPRGGQRVR